MARNKRKKSGYGYETAPVQEISKRKILGKYSSFAAVEAYKAARTNLLFTRKGTGCQKIAVTSSFEAEGKSVNCINMAITLAQNGLRVLIIDCDMRRPVVNKTFGFPESDGLSELLASLVGLETLFTEKSPIHPTWQDNLSVLSAGHTPPNPAELLASPLFERLLAELEPHFDYILIDTPPINVVTDALVLTQLVDGFVLVIRAGNTPMEGLRGSVSRLEQVGASIIGFLLNDVEAKSSYQKYNYKSKRYGYGKYGKYRYGSIYSRYSQGNHAAKATEGKDRSANGGTD